MRRHTLALAAAVLLAGCGLLVKELTPADAKKTIAAHPQFAGGTARLPLAPDVVEPVIGIDAGVLLGIWRYSASSGKPTRELTDKGRQYFKDASGTLAAPAQRELLEVTSLVLDPQDKKHQTAEFTWRYQLVDPVTRFVGLDGTYKGKADFKYDGEWKVQGVTLEAKPRPFPWTGDLGNEARRLLAAEAEASTQRMLAMDPQAFKAPDGTTHVVTVADVQVEVDAPAGRRTVAYVDFLDCRAEAGADGSSMLTFEGIRGSAVARGTARVLPDFEKLCAAAKESQQTWAAHYREVAQRGPLGLNYSR
jgi:hypothetical protein